MGHTVDPYLHVVGIFQIYIYILIDIFVMSMICVDLYDLYDLASCYRVGAF